MHNIFKSIYTDEILNMNVVTWIMNPLLNPQFSKLREKAIYLKYIRQKVK